MVVNNKIYGGVYEAINVVDLSLRMMGLNCLHIQAVDLVKEDSTIFMGESSLLSLSRLSQGTPGNGMLA